MRNTLKINWLIQKRDTEYYNQNVDLVMSDVFYTIILLYFTITAAAINLTLCLVTYFWDLSEICTGRKTICDRYEVDILHARWYKFI